MVESPLDSNRFGFKVVRGRFDRLDAVAILDEIDALRADVAILRLPAARQPEVAGLASAGLPVVVADTLVWYHADLLRHVPAPLRNADLAFERCGEAHHADVDRLVERTFDGYSSHYASNPFLPRDGVLEGYKEWARGHCLPDGDPSGRVAWLVRRAGEPVAFLTCARHADECEGVLYGVTTEASGGGVYGDLIRFSQAHFRDRGARLMKVSTQVQNVAVQKVWSREGFAIAEALLTLHVNAFLSASAVPPAEVPLPADLGDSAPDAALVAAVRDACPLASPYVARLSRATVRPGNGAGARVVRVSFPVLDAGGGRAHAVAQVRPAAGGPLDGVAWLDLAVAPV
ncbi:MAG: hypothetical protein FJ087_00540 [Deltaproteobacteria bacterium]|nr:hypothetical protein [Deltaproteobacteria bacterium]